MVQDQQQQTRPRLPDATSVGNVHLAVSDLTESLAFYRDILGYHVAEIGDGVVELSAGAAGVSFVLHELPGATPNLWRTTGLFHAAILLPERRDLALIVQQLAAHGWDIGGASDHGVSEALYLNDPDGNGLEIYVDRPRSEWPVDGNQVRMVTERLDFESLFAELAGEQADWTGMPAGTRIGHIHLQVSDLEAARHFYVDQLGFSVMQDTFPGALFVAAGGYHHHIGLNVWAGKGVPRPPENAIGLKRFTVYVPDATSIEALADRLTRANVPILHQTEHEIVVSDQDGIRVQVRSQGLHN
jgi:catechol 2,3-dioxygenase